MFSAVIDVQPDFISIPLNIDGAKCLRPDAGTNGAHHGEWMPRLMTDESAFTNTSISPRYTEEEMPHYYISAPQNREAVQRSRAQRRWNRAAPSPSSDSGSVVLGRTPDGGGKGYQGLTTLALGSHGLLRQTGGCRVGAGPT